MNNRSPAVLSLAALLALASPAFAQPILYTLSGNANGSLGGTPFSNAAFSIESVADISQITTLQPGILGVLAATDVTIAGFSRATFQFTNRVVANQNFSRIGVGDFDQNLAVLFMDHAAIQSYGLNTAIGPLTGPPIFGFSSFFPTSAGAMNFTGVFNVSFSAVVVPEPSSLILVGLAIAAGCRGRRHARQTLAPQHSPPPTDA